MQSSGWRYKQPQVLNAVIVNAPFRLASAPGFFRIFGTLLPPLLRNESEGLDWIARINAAWYGSAKPELKFATSLRSSVQPVWPDRIFSLASTKYLFPYLEFSHEFYTATNQLSYSTNIYCPITSWYDALWFSFAGPSNLIMYLKFMSGFVIIVNSSQNVKFVNGFRMDFARLKIHQVRWASLIFLWLYMYIWKIFWYAWSVGPGQGRVHVKCWSL